MWSEEAEIRSPLSLYVYWRGQQNSLTVHLVLGMDQGLNLTRLTTASYAHAHTYTAVN